MMTWTWLICGFISVLMADYLIDNTKDEEILKALDELNGVSRFVILAFVMLLGPISLVGLTVDILKHFMGSSDETDDNN